MSGDAERWRRESEAWKRWEGWIPGDPIPGDIPGLDRADQPTLPPHPAGSHQPVAAPAPVGRTIPPPPPRAAARRAGQVLARRAAVRTARAGRRQDPSPAAALRGCMITVGVMLAIFGGLVPACLAAAGDRVARDSGAGEVVVTERSVQPAP